MAALLVGELALPTRYSANGRVRKLRGAPATTMRAKMDKEEHGGVLAM
jgi:hypothetical protein